MRLAGAGGEPVLLRVWWSRYGGCLARCPESNRYGGGGGPPLGKEPVNWIGRLVAGGRYRVLEGLDKGSQGHVYRAFDERLETDVVLKFPVSADPTVSQAEFLERFQREIRSLVALSHPHIVWII